MKYQFELEHDIICCIDCPCFKDEWYKCRIEDRDLTFEEVYGKKPGWCRMEVE